MKPEESMMPQFNANEVNVYFLVGHPFFDESDAVDLPDLESIRSHEWQTVQVWPLHFFVQGECFLSTNLAYDVHRQCFAYLEAADEESVPRLEMLYDSSSAQLSEQDTETLDRIGILLDTAEARIENKRLQPGEIVVYGENRGARLT